MEAIILTIIIIIPFIFIASVILEKMCKHEWEIVEETQLMEWDENIDKHVKVGKILYMRCKKCGDVKQKIMRV
jgi:hypothetical protein